MTVDDMRVCGWLWAMKVLSAEDVKTLPVGKKLYLIGPDRHGEKSVEEGIIEQIGNARSRRFRVDRPEGVVRRVIRDYPGKVWTVREGVVGG